MSEKMSEEPGGGMGEEDRAKLLVQVAVPWRYIEHRLIALALVDLDASLAREDALRAAAQGNSGRNP